MRADDSTIADESLDTHGAGGAFPLVIAWSAAGTGSASPAGGASDSRRSESE